MDEKRRARREASLAAHGIKGHGISWISLPVYLEESDNEYLAYPVRGVIRLCEQRTDLSIASAVFHCELDDGSLGPPLRVDNARWTYEPPPVLYMGRCDNCGGSRLVVTGGNLTGKQDGLERVHCRTCGRSRHRSTTKEVRV